MLYSDEAKLTNVKKWYIKTYPTDELGEEIRADINFYDVFHALDTYKEIYDYIEVGDSIIRERIFAKLSELMRVDYGEVYDQWLHGHSVRKMSK